LRQTPLYLVNPDRVRRNKNPALPRLALLILLLLSPALVPGALQAGSRQQGGGRPLQPVRLHLETWEARIDPATLAIQARLSGHPSEITVAASASKPWKVSDLNQSEVAARWTLPELLMTVEINAVKNHLRVRMSTKREMNFTWLASGGGPGMSALIVPDGEGLYLPLDDAFWTTLLMRDPCRDTHGGLSMPFWSYQVEGGSLAYLAVSDLDTELCFSQQNGRLSTYAIHHFRRRDGLPAFEVEIWPGGTSPISPAAEYREWLIDQGEYVTLGQKIRANAEVAKLLGAVHAYVFGDGRTPRFLQELSGLGIDRFWLGYDQDPRSQRYIVDETYIAEARKLGYLVGPYDTFDNAQDPKTADAPSSVWDPELYRTGCIINERGEPKKGFAGRGCELSSEALERAEAEKHYIERRVSKHAGTGINSYFLDSDAFGELYDDYSAAHPMTQSQDRLNRLKRMGYIGETRRLVLGSEGGVAWSVPVIDFAHGMEAVSNNVLWALQVDRKTYGGWWPPDRPAIFFKPVIASSDFAQARYDPVYRLPLYQAAFHGAVVTTDRWETPLPKFPDLVQTRTLLELLYGVPSMWSFDLGELRQDSQRLSSLYRFFSPLHRKIGLLPLSDFQWLTADRKVQRSRFGDQVEVIANFGHSAYGPVPPLCVQAHWLHEERRELFCPQPANRPPMLAVGSP
jgi:hypothetical protein